MARTGLKQVRVQIFGHILDVSGRDITECHREVESGIEVAGARSLVNARGLQLQCGRVMYEVY